MPHLCIKEEYNCLVNYTKPAENWYNPRRGTISQPGCPHKTHTRRRERSTVEADYKCRRRHSSASQRLRLVQTPIDVAHTATTRTKSVSSYAKQLATGRSDEITLTLKRVKCRRYMQDSRRRRPPPRPPNTRHRGCLGPSKAAAPTPV